MIYLPFEIVGVGTEVRVGVGVCEVLSSILALVAVTAVVGFRLEPFSASPFCTGV